MSLLVGLFTHTHKCNIRKEVAVLQEVEVPISWNVSEHTT